MNTYRFDRELVSRQIIQNLRDAGMDIPTADTREYMDNLGSLDSKDLLVVLLESHNKKEQVLGKNIPMTETELYFLETRCINLN